MPKIKDYKEKQNEAQSETGAGAEVTSHSKRRPGRDSAKESESVRVVDVSEEIVAHEAAAEAKLEASQEAHAESSEPVQEQAWGKSQEGKVEIKFFGSEILRTKFPKPFDAAEKIATDWVNDGDFSGLPIHPLAQGYAAKGLKRAKQAEKDILESPVTEKVATKVFEVGLKAAELKNKLLKKKS